MKKSILFGIVMLMLLVSSCSKEDPEDPNQFSILNTEWQCYTETIRLEFGTSIAKVIIYSDESDDVSLVCEYGLTYEYTSDTYITFYMQPYRAYLLLYGEAYEEEDFNYDNNLGGYALHNIGGRDNITLYSYFGKENQSHFGTFGFVRKTDN